MHILTCGFPDLNAEFPYRLRLPTPTQHRVLASSQPLHPNFNAMTERGQKLHQAANRIKGDFKSLSGRFVCSVGANFDEVDPVIPTPFPQNSLGSLAHVHVPVVQQSLGPK